MQDETLPKRPDNAARPRTGLAAWESALGYITTEISPDALLTIRASAIDEQHTQWSAALEWNRQQEMVTQQSTIQAALAALWQALESSQAVELSTLEDSRKPLGYSEFEWLDADTRDALERLLWVVQVVFKGDWSLLILYHLTDDPAMRVQARLAAKGGSVHIGGRGASIKDAATQLYRNATPYFSKEKD